MWSATRESLGDGSVNHYKVQWDGRPMSYEAALQHWQSDWGFRTYFNDLLAAAPFSAYRWETPALTASNTQRQFEFVLIDSPGLVRTPEPTAFAEHFHVDGSPSHVVAFPNLGKDAILIVPPPQGPDAWYGHLAAFVRHAPEGQRQALWLEVGNQMEQRLNDQPVWLSTAGAGVAWLHVRLDDRPKYYGHGEYKKSS